MKTIKKIIEAAKMKGKDPCWKGYQMVGTKNKNGKEVPNCVPEEVQQEGAVPSGESVITVKHRTSGKTLRISANAAAKYRAMGYHFHPTNESVEQIDELSNDTLKSYLQKSKDQEGTGLGRQGAGAKHQYSYENSQNGKRNAINRLDARQGKIGKYGVVPKVPGYNKEEVEQIEELSNATLRGYADKARADIQKTLPKLHTDPKAAGRVEKRISGLAASTVAKVKNNMKSEEVESIEEAKGDMNWHRAQENKHEEAGDRMMAKAKSFGAYAHPTGISARKQAEKHYAKADEHRAARKAASVAEETITEISDDTAANYVHKRNLQYVRKMKPDSQGRVQPSDVYNKMSDKHKEGVGRAMNRLIKPVEESDTPAKESLQKRSEKPVAYVHEGAFKRIATDKEEDERLAKQKGSWKVETPWKKVKSDVVVDKSGARHTPMSRARDLARKAFSKVHEQENIQPNPFTVPSVNPGQAPKKKSRQMDIVREARNNAMKKKKEVTEAGSDKFQPDPELTSQITKSNP